MNWQFTDSIQIHSMFMENPDKLLNTTDIHKCSKVIPKPNVNIKDDIELSFSPQDILILPVW